MRGNRLERQEQKRRETLERALAFLKEDQAGPGVQDVDATLFFHDHAALVEGLAEVLEREGLLEACLALARHLEEDRDHWLRRLEQVETQPSLRSRRHELDREYVEVFAAHFRRWGAAGPQGERTARLEALLVLAALRGAEHLWLEGAGRPTLPVLMQEALALLWPALYAHARRRK